MSDTERYADYCDSLSNKENRTMTDEKTAWDQENEQRERREERDADERVIAQNEVRLLDEHRAGLDLLKAEHGSVFAYQSCPGWAVDSFDRYARDGIETGDCLRAVLANDLMGAFARADPDTGRRMAAIASYVYNKLPSTCHGSYEIVDQWVAAHLARRRAEREGVK